jgi:hypothetical protein
VNEASISRDVVTGTPSAPLSKRASKAKKAKAKKAKKAKKADAKGKGLTQKASSSKEGAQGPSPDASKNNMATSNPPSGPSPPKPTAPGKPMVAGDQHDPQRLKSWEILFDGINEALQIAGMLIERLNPALALQYHELSETLKTDAKKYGDFLCLNEGLLPGLAVHFNMQPDEKAVHLDGMSLFAGFVSVSISGELGSTPNSSLRTKC